MMLPLVTVIIPAFNAQHFISDALESALNQDYSNIEIIVVDDGSSDDTAGIVQQYSSVRYIWQENSGAAAARNTGIQAAQGEYVAFLDADDLWHPSKISCQVAQLEKTKGMWCYCNADFLDFSTGQLKETLGQRFPLISGQVFRELILIKLYLPTPTICIRKSALEKIGLFDTKYAIGEDRHLWLRMAMHYPVEVVPERLVTIRRREGSLSNASPEEYDVSILMSSRKDVVLDLAQMFPERFSPYMQEWQVTHEIQSGRMWLRMGNISQARQCFKQALFVQPGKLSLYVYYLSASLGPLTKYLVYLYFKVGRNRRVTVTGWWDREQSDANA